MKSFKQILNESYYMPPQDEVSEQINLDEELSNFNKIINEDGTILYFNEKMSVKLKHEHLHEWVMASGYRYQTKTFRPGVVTEHEYIKRGATNEHHLLIATKGDQRDVYSVAHRTISI